MADVRMRASNRIARACSNCHARKVKCDLAARPLPPCTRCQDAGLQCNIMFRRRRIIRAVESISRDFGGPEQPDTQTSSTSPDDAGAVIVGEAVSSLGEGDEPRRVEVDGRHDISKQKSILVEFLSQDFADADITDYQPTFVDDYASITRLLGREFGRGFSEGVYHYRDAPFVERTYEGIPRSIGPAERVVLEQYGSFMLPSPSISDAFVAAFFDRVFPTMPIMDRSVFLKNLHGAGQSGTKPSLLLVQSILLSGSTAYDHPGIQLLPDEVPARLYARAKALIDTKFEQDRLILVQAHLLISSFTADSCDDTIHNMWLSLGTAVRIAQGIGMHRDLGQAKASASMRRRWKRIWWTLFIHDTICSFEWGRPRAIHFADTDVPLPSEADFAPDELGGLPYTEHVQFFLCLCRLCFIIVDWLELRRPGHMYWGHGSSSPSTDQVNSIREALGSWASDLPAAMQAPRHCRGFSLWTATLHIVYQAVILRVSASSSGPLAAGTAHDAAVSILQIGADLEDSNLLGSLWGFGIHQFDLAMGQHARETKSDEQDASETAFSNLRKGLPLMQQLAQRSSTAAQGLAFYEALLDGRGRFERHDTSPDMRVPVPQSELQQTCGQLENAWGSQSGNLADLGFLDWDTDWQA